MQKDSNFKNDACQTGYLCVEECRFIINTLHKTQFQVDLRLQLCTRHTESDRRDSGE